MATLSVRLDLYVFKLKAHKIILKAESFSFLPLTVLARQRGKYGYGWIPPPPGLIGLMVFLCWLASYLSNLFEARWLKQRHSAYLAWYILTCHV